MISLLKCILKTGKVNESKVGVKIASELNILRAYRLITFVRKLQGLQLRYYMTPAGKLIEE